MKQFNSNQKCVINDMLEWLDMSDDFDLSYIRTSYLYLLDIKDKFYYNQDDANRLNEIHKEYKKRPYKLQ
jgi:hypothetical protein